MRYDTLDAFLTMGREALAKGPVALLFLEDETEVASTVTHHAKLGFRHIVCFCDPVLDLPTTETELSRVAWNAASSMQATDVVNTCAEIAAGTWFYYCFNAEYLYFPFCEHRSVGEMITFNVEERRDTILTFVVDLYAKDLEYHPSGVSLHDAHLDRAGYYALARKDRWNNDLDRQMDFYGGLRWRFEEHIPPRRRRIDRVALFKAKPGALLNEDHTFTDPEYNTFACPWHHSVSAAIVSFRTAKALRRNPGSAHEIDSFRWHNSIPFEWSSTQLLDLGLIEPGQWF